MNSQQMENAIINKTLDVLLAAGYSLEVNDGEETTTPITTDKAMLLEAMYTTDEDYLYCSKSINGDFVRSGYVWFVYGNDGHEVIADYTVSLEDVLAPVNAYSAELCEKFA
jgi:hypothetical protein